MYWNGQCFSDTVIIWFGLYLKLIGIDHDGHYFQTRLSVLMSSPTFRKIFDKNLKSQFLTVFMQQSCTGYFAGRWMKSYLVFSIYSPNNISSYWCRQYRQKEQKRTFLFRVQKSCKDLRTNNMQLSSVMAVWCDFKTNFFLIARKSAKNGITVAVL